MFPRFKVRSETIARGLAGGGGAEPLPSRCLVAKIEAPHKLECCFAHSLLETRPAFVTKARARADIFWKCKCRALFGGGVLLSCGADRRDRGYFWLVRGRCCHVAGFIINSCGVFSLIACNIQCITGWKRRMRHVGWRTYRRRFPPERVFLCR